MNLVVPLGYPRPSGLLGVMVVHTRMMMERCLMRAWMRARTDCNNNNNRVKHGTNLCLEVMALGVLTSTAADSSPIQQRPCNADLSAQQMLLSEYP